MIKVLLIDDEPLATALLQEYLRDYPDLEPVQVCHDGFEGLKAIQNHKPDLIFLDVEMPRINGFEMLELLETAPAVIFTTAYAQHAVRAFDSQAIDYLLKPFSKTRFAQAIQKFRTYSSTNNAVEQPIGNDTEEFLHRVVLKDKNSIKIIPVEEILFFEANDDYVNIHTREGRFLKNKTLSSFEKMLNPKLFIRVHRSYIIKLDQINKIEPYEKEGFMIKLVTGHGVPVSKTGYPKLKLALGL